MTCHAKYLARAQIWALHTLEDVYSLLQHHSCARRNNGLGSNSGDKPHPTEKQGQGDVIPGIQHSQQRNHTSQQVVAKDDSVIRGADGRCNPRVLCYTCQHYGHYSDNCPIQSDTSIFSTPSCTIDTCSTVIKKVQHHMHAAELI